MVWVGVVGWWVWVFFLTFILVCVGKGVKIEFCPAKSKKKCENLHVLPPFPLCVRAVCCVRNTSLPKSEIA